MWKQRYEGVQYQYNHRCAQRNSEKEKGLEKYIFTTCLHQINGYHEHIN